MSAATLSIPRIARLSRFLRWPSHNYCVQGEGGSCVQEGRTVEGGGDLYPLIPEIQKDIVRHACEVGADDDCRGPFFVHGPVFGSRNDCTGSRQRRVTVLLPELKRHRGADCPSSSHGPIRGLGAMSNHRAWRSCRETCKYSQDVRSGSVTTKSAVSSHRHVANFVRIFVA